MPKKPKIKHVERWQSYSLLILNVVLNAVALPLVKPIFSVTTPFRYLFYRFLLASILSLPILWHFGRHHHVTLKRIGLIVLIELVGCVFTLGVLYSGLARTTSLEANIIATSTPIFTVLAGVIYLKEKEELHEWLGLLLAFSGTLMIIFLPILTGKSAFSFMSFTGNALILLQNISAALGFILAKRFYPTIPKLLVTAIASVLAMCSFGFLSYFELGALRSQFMSVIAEDLSQPSVWIAIIYMAVFVTMIASTAYLKGQECIEASEASLFSYLSPLIFFPIAIFIVKDPFNPYQLIGLTVILIGVILAETRIRKLSKVKPKKALKEVKVKRAFKLKADC